jgi:hypothetical protein
MSVKIEEKEQKQVELIQDNIQHRIILINLKWRASGIPFFCNMTPRLWVIGYLQMFKGKAVPSSSQVDMPKAIRH